MKNNSNRKVLLLKIIVIVFILTGIVIGGLNAAFGKSQDIILKTKIKWIYLIYEDVFRVKSI